MEFRFNLHNIFKNKISRIGNSLLPSGYAAPDRRTALEATSYVAEIINSIGQESARAQGLNQPVTTSDRLRNTDDQFVYLLTEENDKNGLVVGLIKVGKKSLYVFDKKGETRHCIAPCVLDFYVHESRQRGGLGKMLFEHMLSYEGVDPIAFAYDRPSEKLLAFLQKHYGLEKKIEQMNNFVIYDGFFDHQNKEKNEHRTNMHITSSPNSNLFGPQFVAEDNPKYRSNSRLRNNAQNVQTSFIGRYGAPKPQSSLNQIIHNKSTTVTSEPMSNALEKLDLNAESSDKAEQGIDTVSQVAESDEHVHTPEDEQPEANVEVIIEPASCAQSEFDENDGTVIEDTESNFDDNQSCMTDENITQPQFILPIQKFGKRMTGRRNISNIIVGTDENMEFDQIEDKGFGVVKINRPYRSRSNAPSVYSGDDNDSAKTPDNALTADGFYDLKFYSHPMW